jgi:hypothetical protein
VRGAVRAWSKSILGAPWRLEDMMVPARRQDEMLVRVATEIQRREVVEQRIADTEGRHPLSRRIDPRSVDPWTLANRELREGTEDVETCPQCQGSGGVGCAACHGSALARCSACGGTGSAAASGGSPARCATCRGSGSLACGQCGGRGGVACNACEGSGQQLVWFEWRQTSRVEVSLVPDSPVADAYPQLTEKRMLAKSDLVAFNVLAAAMSSGASGAISPGALALDDHEELKRVRAPVDVRLDRVSQEQYLRFGAIRHELGYEMCGMRATLQLSGTELVIESDPAAIVPIRVRMVAWGVAAAAIVVGTSLAIALLRGPTAYFHRSNQWQSALLLVFALSATAAAGGLLRMLRPRFRIHPPRRLDVIAILVMFVSFLGVVIIHRAARPTVAEVRDALASGDTERAMRVLAAMEATNPETSDVRVLREDLEYDEVSKLPPDKRLSRLDAIAGRPDALHRSDAAHAARELRLQSVKELVRQTRLADASALLEKIFVGAEADNPDVKELRATIFDAECNACGSDTCRFVSAREADLVSSTAARSYRVKDLRGKLMDSLAEGDKPGETMPDRLQRMRALETNAKAVLRIAGANDTELAERARAVLKWVNDERGKVALLGVDGVTAEALLGSKVETVKDDVLHASMEGGVSVYLALDKAKRCAGVYIVGEPKESRARGLKSELLPSLMLSKALGHPTPLKGLASPGVSASSTWVESGKPVTVRWRDGEVIEIRVGDANPGGTDKIPKPPSGAPSKGGAAVSIVAYPGGDLLVDERLAGRDATGVLKLKPGKHEVKMRSRFLGEDSQTIDVAERQSGPILIGW